MTKPDATTVPTGFRDRTLKTAKLLARTGLKAARHNVLGSRPVDEDAATAAAERLLDELSGLKGLVMKFGQMASYLDHSLSPRAQATLARLQSQSEPMDPEVMAKVIADELGDDPESLFDDFDRAPFAAASIGQVHRGRLGDTEVAIKVQYPGIVEALESDLKIVGRFSRLGFMMSQTDGAALAEELRERVLEECDYTLEAENQRLFRDLFAAYPDRDVPAVIPERSSRRVLTSELSPRRGFQRFAVEAPQAHRDRAGAIIFEASFGTIFRNCVFNADPHPGNYLFGDGGEVTFLDFGCLKWFSEDFIRTWKRVARCILDGDRARFPDRLVETGMVAKTKNFDWDAQWRAMRHLYAPFCDTEPTTYTGEFIQEVRQQLVFDNPNKFKLALPRDWLFVNRLQFGLLSVLVRLGANAAWGPLFREALEADLEPALASAPATAKSAGSLPAERYATPAT